jgi:hypothetical protein
MSEQTKYTALQVDAIETADAYANNCGLPLYSDLLQREHYRLAEEARNEEKTMSEQTKYTALQVDAIETADAYANNCGLPLYSDLLQREHYRLAEEARNEEKTKHAREQAAAQMASIAEMVAALECDYERLQELREARDDWNADSHPTPWSVANTDEAEELAELEEAVGECESREDAEQRIQEDPLSVEVRSGWYQPGGDNEPEEFKILLCTGGPAVQIRGELDQHGEPHRAWLEYQDWFTPWIEYHGDAVNHDALLTYCRQFYFAD